MEWLLAFASADGPVIVAGCFGGALRWAFLRPKMWDGIINIGVGGVLAYYLAPIAIPFLAPVLGNFTTDVANVQRISGLIVGIVGIAIVGFFIDFFQKRAEQLKAAEPEPPKEPGNAR